jgi:hypothetical protein
MGVGTRESKAATLRRGRLLLAYDAAESTNTATANGLQGVLITSAAGDGSSGNAPASGFILIYIRCGRGHTLA